MEESVNVNEVGESLFDSIKKEFELSGAEAGQYSPLTLAFIGDGIYDLIIRTIIVERGNAPVNKLHKRVSNLVKATSQAKLVHAVMEYLSEEEKAVFKRGRNAKSFTSAKNASITDYRTATGFEALMGYLYMSNEMPRALTLVKMGLKLIEDSEE